MKLFMKIIMSAQIILIIYGIRLLFTITPIYGIILIISNAFFLGINTVNLKELEND